MEKLFLYMGVFALVTLAIYGLCLWVIRIEEKRDEKREAKRPS